jgi:hypothetical protein
MSTITVKDGRSRANVKVVLGFGRGASGVAKLGNAI